MHSILLFLLTTIPLVIYILLKDRIFVSPRFKQLVFKLFPVQTSSSEHLCELKFPNQMHDCVGMLAIGTGVQCLPLFN